MAFEERDLFAQPPTREDLARWARQHPGGAEGLVTRYTHFEDYQTYVAGKQFSEDELLDLLARVPNLLHKPIISDGTRVHQGLDFVSLEAFVSGENPPR